MRVFAVCGSLLILLIAAEQVTGDAQFVKLCGREFIRAVIYTCGGSRWRRLLSEAPQDMADRENVFGLHAGDEELTGPVEYKVQKINTQNYEDMQQAGSMEEFWGPQKNSVLERRDLNELLTTACCKTGCKKKDLSSLC